MQKARASIVYSKARRPGVISAAIALAVSLPSGKIDMGPPLRSRPPLLWKLDEIMVGQPPGKSCHCEVGVQGCNLTHRRIAGVGYAIGATEPSNARSDTSRHAQPISATACGSGSLSTERPPFLLISATAVKRQTIGAQHSLPGFVTWRSGNIGHPRHPSMRSPFPANPASRPLSY